ncbi:multiheme c-type cytochrome [Aeoliella sp.]|uniref:multiheme c-type cytochrome n=1 Tax=Aeoliella sp. TaxID=2795800 RepID=UPI003CCBA571
MSKPIPNAGRRGKLWFWLVALLSLVAVSGYAAIDWFSAKPPDALATAKYVGRSSCTECHQTEHNEFLGSDHDRAMELATDESVLGDFNDTQFERLGVTTKFFRRGDEFWVNTEGPDGEYHDYQIKYTFGIDPLQQYMVEFPDGRVQVLRVSWDTVENRWFYVPPPDVLDERILPDDPTHWTNIAQNWNTTCAECHSTDLKKNYDLATNTYHTTFSEIDVSCEACHGPASLHVELAESNSLFWDRRHGYGLAKIKSLDPTPQIETCAPCHSRRSEVHPDFRPGKKFANYYNTSLLREGLYHADGQIEDEVYVYGSFLQSRMHREGVRCSDCHNPHSLELKFEGNALCGQCHVPAKYDTPLHHHHKMDTPAASCVECHMPETSYMVVDPRRDHSIRVPRPDLTVSIGTPNVCNRCHDKAEETPEWAAAKVVEWYGPNRPDDPHWAPAIAGGRKGDPEAQVLIVEALQRKNTPGIVQATLCELLGQFPSQETNNALDKAMKSQDPLVREAAVFNRQLNLRERDVQKRIFPALADPVRTVRIAAVLRVLELPRQYVRQEGLPADFAPALAEYKTQLRLADERAETHLRLAAIAEWSGDEPEAIDELRTAVRLEPYRSGTRAELARHLSMQPGNEQEVLQLRKEEIELLRRDIELLPESGDIRYRLGMQLYLVDKLDDAESELTEALRLSPQNYSFALALALLQQKQYQLGDEEAINRAAKTLRIMHELNPDSPDAANITRELLQLGEQRRGSGSAPSTEEPL